MGIIYQLNLKPATSGERGLPKYPVAEARITLRGVEGDYNRYRAEKKHHRPEAALLIIPLEILRQLNLEGWPICPGDLGENITTLGLSYDSLAPGKKYQVGATVIEISEPCTPCINLQVLPYVGKERVTEFMRILAKPTNRRGWYAKVLQEGRVQRGDALEELLI